MSVDAGKVPVEKPIHSWLCNLNVSFVAGPRNQVLDEAAASLLEAFRRQGHTVQPTPDDSTDVILTTALFGEPLNWREALLFTARRRFDLTDGPTIYTVVHVERGELERTLGHLRSVLPKSPPDPADYDFPGLADEAYQVLFEQGRRGGPMLALERVVQSQAKCIDVLLVVGDDSLDEAYLFNLVGAHPRIPANDLDYLSQDVVKRIVTAESTHEVTDHVAIGEPIPRVVWKRLATPGEMCEAGRQLGLRDFFTEMVRIADLVNVPAVANAVSSQYSEGCFSTWDPSLDALIATVTGSARPVYKGSISEEDLAVIVGLQPDGSGALVRHVEGGSNVPPSSEAVEMIAMDDPLPTVTLGRRWEVPAEVPVVRSKLHGHRGISAYDGRYVEYVPMAAAYHHFPVTCATEAQARGIVNAFSRSEALQNPEDPRQVVFTVLPGHGTVIVEKWVAGTAPFQTMWEAMDRGFLEVSSKVPQGPIAYGSGRDDKQVLRLGED
jgi:hypothetical protein